MVQAPASEGAGHPARTGGLALAAAIVAFGFLGSRLLGILRTVVIARAFGASPELSAYNVAFRIPDLIFQVLAGATLASAFIPVFASVYRGEGEARAWRLASNILTIITIATAALCLLAFVLAPALVPLTAPGLGDEVGRSKELTDQAVSLTRMMLLSPLLFAMSGIVTGILNGRQRFLLSALAPMLYNLAIIFGALFLAGPFGVEGLAAGVVAGAGLHLLVQLPGLVRERMRFRPAFDLRDTATREVGRLMGPRVIGLAATQFNFVISTFFASQIDDRAISNLGFAWVIAGLPLALFGMSLATAIFPRLAEQAAAGERESLAASVSQALRIIMFLTIPAAIGVVMLRQPVTVLLLQRGEFTAADAAVTASALAFYCIGIVPQAGIEIHSRGFYALGDTRTPVTFAVGAVLLNLALSALLWGPFGVEGLAAAVSIASWAEWALLYRAYARRTGAPWREDVAALANFAVCGAVMGLVLGGSFAFLETGGQVTSLVTGVAGAVAGAAVYAGLASFLRLPEFVAALERAVRLVRRGGAS